VCLVTNLPRYRCDHCIAKDPSARAQVGRTITTTTTTARYKGQCNASVTAISRTFQAIGRDRTRVLSYLPL
jgi:hypothetical protein